MTKFDRGTCVSRRTSLERHNLHVGFSGSEQGLRVTAVQGPVLCFQMLQMDPLEGSIIYTMGVLDSRSGGSIFGSSQNSGFPPTGAQTWPTRATEELLAL